MVYKAIKADHAGEYQKAFDLYMSSMEHWVKALKWEEDKVVKALMQEKVTTYLDRAEKIKQFLAAKTDNINSGKAPMGGNRLSTGNITSAPEDDVEAEDDDASEGKHPQRRKPWHHEETRTNPRTHVY